MSDRELHFRLHSRRDRLEEECHIYDEVGNKLGILRGVLKVTTVMEWNRGYPVMTIETIVEDVDATTLQHQVRGRTRP
jgi:hypothetical protein